MNSVNIVLHNRGTFQRENGNKIIINVIKFILKIVLKLRLPQTSMNFNDCSYNIHVFLAIKYGTLDLLSTMFFSMSLDFHSAVNYEESRQVNILLISTLSIYTMTNNDVF